ncbi:TonB-dependent receptor plug domain-containing protein [Terricaulis sp.]|uniref:TonB-dependent receptor plug domain-containing protein n=1 Tax=Terricaulis sp. TaxID=2768686 RepID=UPI0037846142
MIVAPRLPERPGERAYSVTAIDPILIARAARVDGALQSVPGVSLFRRNESGGANPTTQGLSVRALGPTGAGRTLVMLDGVPQGDPFGGWVIWGALPPDTISSARVLRGAGAGSYGAGALTGAVLLDERNAPGWRVSAEGGENDWRRFAGVGEARDERWDFMLAAVSEEDDGWIPVRVSGAADTPLTLASAAAVARAQARWGGNLLSLRFSGYGEERGSGQAGAGSRASGSTASLTFVSNPYGGVFSWRAQGWVMESDLASRFVSVAPDRSATSPANAQIATPAFGWGVNASGRWTRVASGLELGVDVRGAEGETHEFFRFMSGAFTRYREAGGETFLYGVYAEAWGRLGGTLLTGGLRVDRWDTLSGFRIEQDTGSGAATLDLHPADNTETAVTGRVGLRREFGAAYVRSSVYRGFRPPTLNELHRPFRVGNDVTEANPGLAPETLWGADIGVGQAGAGIAWDIGAFYNRLDDPIGNVTLGVGPGTFPPDVFVPAGGAYRMRQNSGSLEARGAEARIDIAFTSTLTGRLAANYTETRAEQGLRAAQSPAWSATAGLEWRYGDGGSISFDARGESSRFDDDLNTRRLAGYLALDVRWEQSIARGASLYLVVENAADADIETAATADGVLSYARPRAARFGLRLHD